MTAAAPASAPAVSRPAAHRGDHRVTLWCRAGRWVAEVACDECRWRVRQGQTDVLDGPHMLTGWAESAYDAHLAQTGTTT